MTKLRWLIVLALVLFGAPNVWAANGTWDNPLGGDWNTPGNWVGGIIPTGQNDVATFPDLGGPVDVSAPTLSLGGLTFDSPHFYTVSGNTQYLKNNFMWTVLQGQHEVNWRVEPELNGADVVMDVAAGAKLTWTNIIYEYQPPEKRTGVVKNGDGTAVIRPSFPNPYTWGDNRQYRRETVVNAGTLLINNDHPDGAGLGISTSSTLQVNDGGTLGGVGIIGLPGKPGTVNVHLGGTIAPGDGVGTLTLGNGLMLADGSALAVELGAASDLLMVTGGTLTGSGTGGVSVSIADAGGLVMGNTYDLINFNGATPSGVEADDFLAAGPYAGSTFGISDGILQVTVVPEPGTIAMLLGGLVVGLVLLRRRRR